MALSRTQEQTEMNCSIQGCPGEYELRAIAHTVRSRGRMIVIDHVPAEICSICGDVLLTPDTVRTIETMLASTDRLPSGSVPLYEYSS
jgi:YgiT-type zinc finger domain-containing protein